MNASKFGIALLALALSVGSAMAQGSYGGGRKKGHETHGRGGDGVHSRSGGKESGGRASHPTISGGNKNTSSSRIARVEPGQSGHGRAEGHVGNGRLLSSRGQEGVRPRKDPQSKGDQGHSAKTNEGPHGRGGHVGNGKRVIHGGAPTGL